MEAGEMPGLPPLGRSAGTRILLVEGDDDDADEMRDILDHAGWSVTRAASVLDAIRAAGDGIFDAAVLESDLPDGRGVDLLNFLRITSPAIRILVLGADGGEDAAFHALSSGAGDFLVKDHHLPEELPRRVDALMGNGTDPVTALVGTIRPTTPTLVRVHDDITDEDVAPSQASRAKPELEPVLDEAVGTTAFAAAVYDARGRILAERLVPPLDAHDLGFGLASIHHQVASLWATASIQPVSYVLLVRIEGGLLGITAVPGQVLVALLMPEETGATKALERLTTFARGVSTALGHD